MIPTWWRVPAVFIHGTRWLQWPFLASCNVVLSDPRRKPGAAAAPSFYRMRAITTSPLRSKVRTGRSPNCVNKVISKPKNVIFVEGETKDTLPRYRLEGLMDLVLLDGPHAYPLPQIEFAYLFPHIKLGGWLVVDDIQIPSVNELFRFLRREPSLALEEVVVRTAFFRRIKVVESGPDGWALQGMNRHTILRYSWRDRFRHLLGRVARIAGKTV